MSEFISKRSSWSQSWPRSADLSVRPRRSYLRRTHRLGHSEENRHAISAATSRIRLGVARVLETTVPNLPVVHYPHITCWTDRQIGLHLQPASHVASWWRNLASCFHAGRAIFGARAAQFHNRAAWHSEVGDPYIIVPIHYDCPRAGKPATGERRPRILTAVRMQQRNAASVFAGLARHESCKGLVGILSRFQN